MVLAGTGVPSSGLQQMTGYHRESVKTSRRLPLGRITRRRRPIVFRSIWGPRLRAERLFVSRPQLCRNAQLVVDQLLDLCRRLRGYRVVHDICDNGSFQHSRLVREFLVQHHGGIRFHVLPKYAPETDPIERVWWHFHENVTGNHRCRDKQQRLGDASDFLETYNRYCFELLCVFARAAQRFEPDEGLYWTTMYNGASGGL